jgi:hypothetical protein
MILHRQVTKTKELRMLQVIKHIHKCSGGKFNNFPLQKVFNESDFFRKEKQKLLIKLLKPQLKAQF